MEACRWGSNSKTYRSAHCETWIRTHACHTPKTLTTMHNTSQKRTCPEKPDPHKQAVFRDVSLVKFCKAVLEVYALWYYPYALLLPSDLWTKGRRGKIVHSIPLIVHHCSIGLSLWGDHNRRWRGHGRQGKREITLKTNKQTPNAILHLQSLWTVPSLGKPRPKGQNYPFWELILDNGFTCITAPLNLAVSLTMSLGPPLIYACERQRLVFMLFERQAPWHPELLSALSKVTQLITRKTENKVRLPDCQT